MELQHYFLYFPDYPNSPIVKETLEKFAYDHEEVSPGLYFFCGEKDLFIGEYIGLLNGMLDKVLDTFLQHNLPEPEYFIGSLEETFYTFDTDVPEL